MSGDHHAGRMVASVLDCLGMDELIANDVDSYLQIVEGLCADQERLLAYRGGLRKCLELSPLRDEIGFTRSLEAEFERIIRF